MRAALSEQCAERDGWCSPVPRDAVGAHGGRRAGRKEGVEKPHCSKAKLGMEQRKGCEG